MPPEKNGDYAFLLHILTSLKSRGKGAVILPHGVLFRGNAEAEIRKAIIRKGYIKAIIGLAPNLFYGTGIPACIIVLDKENAGGRRGIFMIDASRDFVKDGNKNRLREQDIRKIIDVFTGQLTVPKYARMVPVAEIETNDYNLNIPRYIDSQEPEDTQDIAAHLLGGIPKADVAALQAYWAICPTLAQTLFADDLRPGYCGLTVAADQIKPTIYEHPEFVAYRQTIDATFAHWRATHTDTLKALRVGLKPKALIQTLGDDLLRAFARVQLMDKYDVFGHLMTYWLDTMQDDVYQISVDGWVATPAFKRKPNGKLSDEWECDLIPKAYVIRRFLHTEQAEADRLEAEADALTRQLEELDEEHGGEEGLFAQAEVLTDKGTVDRKALAKRLKTLRAAFGRAAPTLFIDETTGQTLDKAVVLTLLENYLKLTEREATAHRKAREAHADVDRKALARYETLTDDELKTLVVDDKWMAALSAALTSELERVSARLSGRIGELADRYATPLPQLTTRVATLTDRVASHLQTMGFVW